MTKTMRKLMTTKLYVDIAERVLATFVLTFLTTWLAADAVNLTNLSVVKSAGLAGLAAAASFVKGMLASRIGDNTAALLPADDPAPG